MAVAAAVVEADFLPLAEETTAAAVAIVSAALAVEEVAVRK